MRRVVNKLLRIIAVATLGVVVLLSSPKNAKADEVTDAILAQQAALYQQQLAAIQAYQQALLIQQQQAMADQYAKALLVFQQQQAQQQLALQQAYMLKSIQQAQKAKYESLLVQTNKEYQDHLLSEYTKYQKQAIESFKGYEGLK